MKSCKESFAGRFISFEGADGSLKAVVARRVFEELRIKNNRVIFLEKNHPVMSSGYAAYHLARIREVLWDYESDAPLDALGDQHWLHLLASWFHALDHGVIQPAIERSDTVIANGWFYKYRSRFSLKANSFPDDSQHAFQRIKEPDLTILLDVNPEVALKRKGSNLKPSESGLMDGSSGQREGSFLEYQTKVRANLIQNAGENWTVIDTSEMKIDAIVRRSIMAIESFFGAQLQTED
jgi:dTMP kinase